MPSNCSRPSCCCSTSARYRVDNFTFGASVGALRKFWKLARARGWIPNVAVFAFLLLRALGWQVNGRHAVLLTHTKILVPQLTSLANFRLTTYGVCWLRHRIVETFLATACEFVPIKSVAALDHACALFIRNFRHWLAVTSFFVPFLACFTRIGISCESDSWIDDAVALRWNRLGADFDLKRTAIFSFFGSFTLARDRVEYFVVTTLSSDTLDWLSVRQATARRHIPLIARFAFRFLRTSWLWFGSF